MTTVAAGGAERAAPETALRDYSRRTSKIRADAFARGAIDYDQVIAMVYPEGVVDSQIHRQKAGWRERYASRFSFISDYALSGSPAAVRSFSPQANARLRSTLVARYEATAHVISISAAAPDYSVLHEAGHSLQRETLSARGSAGSRRPHDHTDFLRHLPGPGSIESTTVRRLQYLCAQEEFEVRLQDLNRFYAVMVTGAPIMNAGDTLKALSALGMELDFEDVAQAFRLAGTQLDRATFDAAVALSPTAGPEVAEAFEDARELLMVQNLTQQADQALWHAVLAKMIFEAPGHL